MRVKRKKKKKALQELVKNVTEGEAEKAIKPDKGTMEKDNCCNGTIPSKSMTGTSSIILSVTI